MIRIIQYAFLLLILQGCAQVVAPTGGMRDTDPPKVILAYPPNQTTNFNSKKIVLRFDEYVQLSNPSQQIVISPPMETKPEFKIEGKTIVVEVRDTLKKNTTYNINFGNAIVDVREQTPLAGYTYSFATGDYIDSLFISGQAVDAFNLQPCKDCLAALYDNDTFNDSTLATQKPVYFAKTNDAGYFKINNLPNETYRLIVFNDANKNLKLEKNEMLGFVNTPVQTTDTIEYRIRMFESDAYKPSTLLDTFSNANGRFNFIFYKPFGIRVLNAANVAQYSFIKPGAKHFDTILVFIADTSLVPDFDIHTPDTTYTLRMRKSKVARIPSFNITINRDINVDDSIHISLKNPIKTFDTSRIHLLIDTVQLVYTYVLDSLRNRLLIYNPWEEGTRYTLEVNDSALYDIYNQTNEAQKLDWTTKTQKDYANLLFHVGGCDSDKQYIIQFWDDAEKNLLKTYIISADTSIEWNNILPTKMKIKLIEDINKNSLWDNGNFKNNIQPEKVMYYKDIIVLRAYWDMEINLNMDNLGN
jgi:hypothetical protein